MKLRGLMLSGLVLLSLRGMVVTNEVQVEKVQVDELYQEATNAMDSIYRSIKIVDQDFKNGIITIYIANNTDYSFHNMMVHMELVNKNKEAYYVETAFIFDGLDAKEERVIVYELADPNMLADLDTFNFCTEGF